MSIIQVSKILKIVRIWKPMLYYGNLPPYYFIVIDSEAPTSI